MSYAQFIASKTQAGADSGFEPLPEPGAPAPTAHGAAIA